MSTVADVPTTDIDPFSDRFLADPFPDLAKLRDLGPVFRLARYGIWGVARHAEVTAVLGDWQKFSSAYGVGYTHLAREKPWRVPSIILEVDPPLHTRTRGIISKILSPHALRALRSTFVAEAEQVAAEVVARGEFDVVKDLAEVYPVKVFADAVGLRAGGRENLLRYGQMTFNGHGPRNHLFEGAMDIADEVRTWITRQCARDALMPNGFGAQIYEAVDAGELSEEEGALLVRSFLSAGVDTTVSAIGFAIQNFAAQPEQWDSLRADPSKARNAFDEVVRIEAPVIGFFRTATKAVELGGARIAQGDKILVLYAGATRDPRKWDHPDEFDIDRRTTGHTGFGYGIHACVGQVVARMEGEAILQALVPGVARWEIIGSPDVRLNNTLRGLASLPVRAVSA